MKASIKCTRRLNKYLSQPSSLVSHGENHRSCPCSQPQTPLVFALSSEEKQERGTKSFLEHRPVKNSNPEAPAHSSKRNSRPTRSSNFRTKSGIRERTSVVPLRINRTKEIVTTCQRMYNQCRRRRPTQLEGRPESRKGEDVKECR